MSLSSLQITNFRNIISASYEFNPSCNLFYGPNGSGKTSILEAIHYLGLGKSFRSHLLKRIVNYDATKFSLFGKVSSETGIIPVGIDRSTLENENQIKIANDIVRSTAELAKILPLQLLNQNVYHFFEHGPKMRRQLVDWGVFHVEPTFINCWRRAEKILVHRNSLLRTRDQFGQIKSWDQELANLSIEIDKMRKNYLAKLFAILHTHLNTFLPDFNVEIDYYPGWDTNINLVEILTKSLSRDLQLGYTFYGPQRADLNFTVEGTPAHDMLSRGQQKMLLYALKLAQGELLNQLTNKQCIYLIDDLSSELDLNHRKILTKSLIDLDTQIFITGLEEQGLQSLFENCDKKMFHVEHT